NFQHFDCEIGEYLLLFQALGQTLAFPNPNGGAQNTVENLAAAHRLAGGFESWNQRQSALQEGSQNSRKVGYLILQSNLSEQRQRQQCLIDLFRTFVTVFPAP